MEFDDDILGTNIAQFNIGVVPVEQNSKAVVEADAPEQRHAGDDSLQRDLLEHQRAKTAKQDALAADRKNEVDSKQLERAVDDVSDFLDNSARMLRFTTDEASGRAVIKVTDKQTGDVIRQIPSDEVLELAKRIKDLQDDVGKAIGMLIDKEV